MVVAFVMKYEYGEFKIKDLSERERILFACLFSDERDSAIQAKCFTTNYMK